MAIKSFFYISFSILLLTTVACNNIAADTDSETKEKEKVDKLLVRSEQGDNLTVGFMHHDEFYAASEEKLKEFLSYIAKADFTSLNIVLNEKKSNGTISASATIDEGNRTVNIALGLEIDARNKRLVMRENTCECISSGCDVPNCVPETYQGGCICSDCEEDCTRQSVSMPSKDRFDFFYGKSQ